jgi:hypothetical protein
MTVQEFLAIYPKYECREYTEIANYLAIATTYCPQMVWGARQPFGIQLLTAHFLETSWQQDLIAAGMATSISQSGSVQVAGAFEDTLTQTTYGREYRLMRDVVPVAPIFI